MATAEKTLSRKAIFDNVIGCGSLPFLACDEENVWQLCHHIKKNHPDKLGEYYAVFISNNNKTVPVWQQKACKANVTRPVVWDYHVILVQKGESVIVFDLDTRLDFPCSFDVYVAKAFGSEEQIHPQFHRSFRVVEAEAYLLKFASDRSHMLKPDKTWMAPPPTYPCIATAESTTNLDSFISMDKATGCGRVLNLQEFIEMFSSSETFTQLPSLLKV